MSYYWEERIGALLRDVEILTKRAEAAEQERDEWRDTARNEMVGRAAAEAEVSRLTEIKEYAERTHEEMRAKLAEAQAEFLSWNEAQASGRELELEAKLADALVKADCGATTPEPCRLSPPCLTCYTVAKEAEVERLREAITGLRAAHHSGDRDEWEAAVRAALRGGGE